MDWTVAPATTLAVVVGASAFPDYPSLDPSRAFANSAEDFCAYLVDPDGMALPPTNLLNLFDSAKPPSELDKEIAGFLRARSSLATDIIIFYVGHGGFTGANSDYYLALRSTTATNPGISSLRIMDLASRLNESARHLRRYIILDSCFAGSAQTVSCLPWFK